MKLYYVKIDKDWDELDIEDSVIFELPTGTIEYEIREEEGLYLKNHNGSNSEIFSKLEKNGESYVKSIVGYDCTGFFPEVKSIYDLKKAIKALDDECVKKFGMPKIEFKPKFKVGDYIVTSMDSVRSHLKNYNTFCDGTEEKPKEELNLFPTKKHYQLNFNY